MSQDTKAAMTPEAMEFLISAVAQTAQAALRDAQLVKAGALTEEELVAKWSEAGALVRSGQAAFERAGETEAAKAAENGG